MMVAGGATRSETWLQMHAGTMYILRYCSLVSSLCITICIFITDITGVPVSTGVFDNSPVLGCGVLAAVGCGLHDSISDAVIAMVQQRTQIEPSIENKSKYDVVYKVCSRIAVFLINFVMIYL